jgi:hypothetical protein
MMRRGTKQGRFFELAAVLVERLCVTELYLGGPAFGYCCAGDAFDLPESVTLPGNGLVCEFYSS